MQQWITKKNVEFHLITLYVNNATKHPWQNPCTWDEIALYVHALICRFQKDFRPIHTCWQWGPSCCYGIHLWCPGNFRYWLWKVQNMEFTWDNWTEFLSQFMFYCVIFWLMGQPWPVCVNKNYYYYCVIFLIMFHFISERVANGTAS